MEEELGGLAGWTGMRTGVLLPTEVYPALVFLSTA